MRFRPEEYLLAVDLVEDVVQETFYHAFRVDTHLPSDGDVLHYLRGLSFGVARWQAVKNVRRVAGTFKIRNKRRWKRRAPPPIEQFPEPDRTSRAERYRQLMSLVLSWCSPAEKDVLELVYFEGRQFKSAAMQLGVSESAFYNQVKLLLRKLRWRMREYVVTEGQHRIALGPDAAALKEVGDPEESVDREKAIEQWASIVRQRLFSHDTIRFRHSRRQLGNQVEPGQLGRDQVEADQLIDDQVEAGQLAGDQVEHVAGDVDRLERLAAPICCPTS